MKFISIVVLLFLITITTQATVLGDAVASMQPGTWKEVDLGLTSSLYDDQNIFCYSNDAVWDPATQKVLFMNRDHGKPWKFIIYDAQSNKWSRGPLPFSSHGGHVYDNLTMDYDHGYMYWYTNAHEMFQYNPATNSWKLIPANGTQPTTGHGMGIEYFPEMNGMIHVYGCGGNGKISFYNLTTKTWSRIGTSYAMGPYHNLAEYNPVHKCVIVGGGNGSSDLYKVDASGNVTKIKNAPADVNSHVSLLTCDRVSGTFLLRTETRLYGYNVTTDSWSTLSSGTWLDPHKSVVATINTYGVVLFLNRYQPYCLLYKHSSNNDNTPPSAPTNLNGQAVSPSQIDLSWTKSADNESGIVNYKIFRNSALIAQTAGTTYSDNGLTENTAYTYQVSALNGAWLESSKSNIVTVTTHKDLSPPTVIQVTAAGDPQKVIIEFSENLDKASAENTANYGISPSIETMSAALGSNGRTVTLATGTHAEGVNYTLTINNIKDASSAGNTIAQNTEATYQFLPKLIVTLVAYYGADDTPSVVIDGFVEGAVEANDRSGAKWTNIPPELHGQTYLLTARDDKNNAKAENEVFYTVHVGSGCDVLALVDQAVAEPSWIAADGWENTGLTVNGAGDTYAVYRKYVSNAGNIDLKRQKHGDCQGTGYVFMLPGAFGTLVQTGNNMGIGSLPVISAFPNPFNSAVKIAIGNWPLAIGNVSIVIYNVAGKLVAKLKTNSQQLKAGFTWNAQGLTPGIYYARLQAGNNVYTKKLMLMK
jgi:hypothetical protein